MPTDRRLLQRAPIALGLALALLLGACTSGSDDASPSAATSSVGEGESLDGPGGGSEGTEDADTTDLGEPDLENPDVENPDTDTTEVTLAEPPRLVVWADDLRANVIEEVAGTFEETTGVTVTVARMDVGAIRSGLDDPSSTTSGRAPDVFIGPSTWTGALVDNGDVAPIDLGSARPNLVASAVDAFTYAGEVYAAPYAADALALYVNTDLVDTPPTNLDEILATCASLEDDLGDAQNDTGAGGTVPLVGCLAVPGGGGEPDAYHHYPFLTAFGGGVFAFEPGRGFDVSTPLLDSDEVVEGVDMVDDLADAGVIPSLTYAEARSAFVAGRIPFLVTGPWEVGPLGDEELPWTVVALPDVEDSRLTSPVTAQGLFIGGQSANPVIAQTFITEFVLTDDVLAALHAADTRPSPVLAIVEQEAGDPIRSAFNQSVIDGDPFPNLAGLEPLWDAIGRAMAEVRTGEAIPDQVLAPALEVLDRLSAAAGPAESSDG